MSGITFRASRVKNQMLDFTYKASGVTLLLLLVILTACAPETTEPLPTSYLDSQNNTITGVVNDENGSLSGATVRVQTSKRFTTTGGDGRFSLEVDGLGDGPFDLTAWAPGYFCSGPVEASSGQDGVELVLHAHADVDNPEYAWLPSQYHPGEGEDQGCTECHSSEGTNLAYPCRWTNGCRTPIQARLPILDSGACTQALTCAATRARRPVMVTAATMALSLCALTRMKHITDRVTNWIFLTQTATAQPAIRQRPQ